MDRFWVFIVAFAGLLFLGLSSAKAENVIDASSATNSSAAVSANRYGFFGLLDHRSKYGTFWFPEPFRVDETDVDNELRADWVHLEGKGHVADEVTAELEKSFGLVTVEAEFHYERDTLLGPDPATGIISRSREEGIGNIDLSVRAPVFQIVSPNGVFDNTVGVAFEVGIPTNSSISKNTELVPKVFDSFRIGEHFSLQTLFGDSFLLGSKPDGGTQHFEYAGVFGYAFNQQDIQLRSIQQIIPIFEITGELGINKADAGVNSMTGTAGIRINFDSIGSLQPRIGVGYVFPMERNSRDEFRWGIVTSLIFEY